MQWLWFGVLQQAAGSRTPHDNLPPPEYQPGSSVYYSSVNDEVGPCICSWMSGFFFRPILILSSAPRRRHNTQIDRLARLTQPLLSLSPNTTTTTETTTKQVDYDYANPGRIGHVSVPAEESSYGFSDSGSLTTRGDESYEQPVASFKRCCCFVLFCFVLFCCVSPRSGDFYILLPPPPLLVTHRFSPAVAQHSSSPPLAAALHAPLLTS